MSTPGPITRLSDDLTDQIFEWLCTPRYSLRSNNFGLKDVLPLAHVCRSWRALALRTQVKTVGIERVCTERCTRNNNHGFGLVSNIATIVSMGLTSSVTDLTISFAPGCRCMPPILGILRVFKANGKKWTGVKSVTFYGTGIARHLTTPDQISAMDREIDQAFDMFTGLFPNITSIAYNQFKYGGATRNYDNSPDPLLLMYKGLIRHYRKQLTSIYGYHSLIPRTISSMEFEATSLKMNLGYIDHDSGYPQFNASVLREVMFYNISGDVIWNWFKPTKDNEIVFSNLTLLSLAFCFRPPLSTKLDPTSGSIVRFPRLSSLSVDNSARYYDDLYSLFRHSPIKVLKMGEDLKYLSSIDTRIVSQAKSFTLNSQPCEYVSAQLPHETITRFYNAMHCALEVSMTSNPFPLTYIERLAWVVSLTIELSDDQFPQLFGAIRRLPQLRTLHITHLGNWSASSPLYIWEPSFETAEVEEIPIPNITEDDLGDTSDLLPISTTLRNLRIHHGGPDVLWYTCSLVRSLPSLEVIAVHRGNISGLEALRTARKGMFDIRIYYTK